MDKNLLEKGYLEFEPSKIDSDFVETCFQKRFDDDQGKKYFITIKKINFSAIFPEDFPKYKYEFNVQLYQKYTHYPINLTFFDGWDVEQVEKYMEKIWNSEEYDYYELFYM